MEAATEPERICKQCPPDQREERRIMLRQEAPDGRAWYLCIKCWKDWDRDERGFRLAGVMVNSTEAPVTDPPVAATTIPLPSGPDARTPGRTTSRKPRQRT